MTTAEIRLMRVLAKGDSTEKEFRQKQHNNASHTVKLALGLVSQRMVRVLNEVLEKDKIVNRTFQLTDKSHCHLIEIDGKSDRIAQPKGYSIPALLKPAMMTSHRAGADDFLKIKSARA